MKTTIPAQLSIVPIRTTTRVTTQTLHILTFIHRFRHVTAKHLQASLGHTSVTTTHNRLSLLYTKGYLVRQYGPDDVAHNQPMSYCLTPEGLVVLRAYYPQRQFRQLRSIQLDATLGLRSRERCHILADVYVHFKRHFNGRFEFFAAHDIANLEHMPDETPDGYVRVDLPDASTQHYLIEIAGTSRATYQQQRRFSNYLQFFESNRWETSQVSRNPSLLVITGSPETQRRLQYQYRSYLADCMVNDFCVLTTTRRQLDTPEVSIWREVQHGEWDHVHPND